MIDPKVIPQEPVQRVVPAAAPVQAPTDFPAVADSQITDLLARLNEAGKKGSNQQRNHLLHSLTALATIADDYDKPQASSEALEAAYRLVTFNMEDLRLSGQPMPIALIEVTEEAPSPILGLGGARETEVKIRVSISSPATACLAFLSKGLRQGTVFDSEQINATIKESTVLIDGMRSGAQSIEDHLAKFKEAVTTPREIPAPSPIITP